MCARVFKCLFYIFFALFMQLSVRAEPFRVHKTHLLQIENSLTLNENSIEVGTNDALVLVLPQNMDFVEGIEVTFKVPQLVAQERDSIAWTFYSGITPDPDLQVQDYRGMRGALGTFGSSLSLTIKIPLMEKNTIKKDSYSYFLTQVPDFSGGKIFIRLWQVMKGISEEIYDAHFEVSARPIFINKGRLILNAKAPNGGETKAFSVFLDEKAIEIGKDGLLLSPGIHTVNIISDYYRNEVRTVTVEKAKDCFLDIQLRDITPIIRIASPSVSEVSIDGRKLEAGEDTVSVKSGDHTIVFKVGNYELVRSIQVQNGRTYTVSVTIDAKITEEE